MNYGQFYDQAVTGDCLLVHGQNAEQKAIQIATNNPMNHVAGIIRPEGCGLLISEFVEPGGYQSMTLEDWLVGRQGQEFYYGRAPQIVRDNAPLIVAEVNKLKDTHYDFNILPFIVLSQHTCRTYPASSFVCSTWWQYIFAIAGYKTMGNASPGDFLKFCESVSFIK